MSETTAAFSRRMSVSTREIPWGTPLGGSSQRLLASAGAIGRRMSLRQSLSGSHKTDHTAKHPPPGAGANSSTAENTYRLGPSASEEFNPKEVKRVLEDLLDAFLDGETYEYKKCSQMATNLTDVIRSRLKEMNFPRFRFVCKVLVGQDKQQSMEYASRCIWDEQTDNYVTVCYRKGNLFAVATVFAVYFE